MNIVLIAFCAIGFLLLFLFLYFYRRNDLVFYEELAVSDVIREMGKRDIVKGLSPNWRLEEYNRISYNEMWLKFWIPVEKFHYDKPYLKEKLVCPDCGGAKTLSGLACGDFGTSAPITIKCSLCEGTGEVDAIYTVWKRRGDELKRVRMAAHLGLREFCKANDLSIMHVSDYERGKKVPEYAISRIEKAMRKYVPD